MTQLEDLSQARVDRSPQVDGATRAITAGKRRRRRRTAVAATVVGLAALFIPLETVLLSTSSSPQPANPAPVKPAPVSQPIRYTAVGQLFQYETPQRHVCLTGDLFTTGSPMAAAATCRYETTVRNVDVRQLPKVTTKDGVTQTVGTVRVVGTYSAGVLTLTQRPVAATPPSPELNFPIPCPTPAGGWKGSDPVNISNADENVMTAYQAGHLATFGGWWLGRAPVPVIVVGVTTDVAGAQQELAGKLQGDVCVTKVAHTDKYLTSESNVLTRLDTARGPLNLSSYGANPVTSTLDVGLRIADAPTRRFFAAHFPPGVIRLKPFLVEVR